MNNQEYYKKILRRLGRSCAIWRRKQGISLKQIAQETRYSTGNVYHFEQGINDNVIIFSWYLEKGFDIDKDVIVGHMYDGEQIIAIFGSFDTLLNRISRGEI